jgi:hypothetical protein
MVASFQTQLEITSGSDSRCFIGGWEYEQTLPDNFTELRFYSDQASGWGVGTRIRVIDPTRIGTQTETRNQYSGNATLAQYNKQYIGLQTTTAGAGFQITLPASPVEGDEVWYKDEEDDANANNVTISGNGNNIDQAATYVVSTDSEGGVLKFEFNQWWLF